MNKVRIGITAIALMVGFVSAFAAKAGALGHTYWTIVSTHARVTLATAAAKCPGGAIKCAVQYTTASNLPTGVIKFKAF